jgi:hypothetical protein
MGKDFKCIITETTRAAEWQKHLGTTTVYVKSPIPSWASLPGIPRAQIYELDLELLTPVQRENLVIWLAEKFDLPADEVRADLEKYGVPILAEHCVVTVEHPHRWLT